MTQIKSYVLQLPQFSTMRLSTQLTASTCPHPLTGMLWTEYTVLQELSGSSDAIQ